MSKHCCLLVLLVFTLVACNQNEPAASSGALPGYFSVEKDTKVQFSKGNLQYQPSTKKWRFAENQTDIIGAENANISQENYLGWIDLFGWGTGNNPTCATTEKSDYLSFSDWGKNAISNGGKTKNMWRTLTQSEWSYIFYFRENCDNLRGMATVNGVCGYILLPDGWTAPSSLTFVGDTKIFSSNVYEADAWKKMEASGAVFLPCTGRRSGTNVHALNSGYYWSSTYGSWDDAFGVYFSEEYKSISVEKWNYRYNANAVRLVK